MKIVRHDNGLKRASLKEAPDFFRVPGRKINEQNDIRLMKGFETFRSAKIERNKRVYTLWRSKNEEDQLLGERLSECRQGHRCLSTACPICFRQLRRWWLAEAKHIFDSFSGGRVATVIFYSAAMTDDQLDIFDPTKLHNRLRKQLNRSGFKLPVIGSLELDYHVEDELWHPHYHLLIFDVKADVEKIRKVLNGSTNKMPKAYIDRVPSNKVYRPLLVQKIKNSRRQLSYLFKSYSKHITAWYASGKRKTRSTRLRVSQERLVLRFKDRVGFKGLMFLYKARQVGNQLVATVSTTKSDE
jgi:hypothetical protein